MQKFMRLFFLGLFFILFMTTQIKADGCLTYDSLCSTMYDKCCTSMKCKGFFFGYCKSI
uniref:Teratocyte protein CftICK-III n=1 Tax=Cotesia flavipes TaxID=89805 RepID=TP3_COTFL|nr:RecName: Full=Teratocyte protein CftICK-III; Flags: Precursor [Cotesia flavipes]UEP64308.1 teratocyte toxin/Knottin [Cotesia flavipes]